MTSVVEAARGHLDHGPSAPTRRHLHSEVLARRLLPGDQLGNRCVDRCVHLTSLP